jgi:carbamoyltransferase
MNILGLSAFADSSAALVRDGAVVCAIEEERLNRIKHYEGMPWLSMHECLRLGSLRVGDIDAIAFGWDPFRGWRTRIAATIISLFRTPQAFGGKLARSDGYLKGCKNILCMKSALRRMHPTEESRQTVHYVPHHDAHAASAFLTSPYDTANIIVADGIGESASVSFYTGEGTSIRRTGAIPFPHSLGHVYASVTGFLGFRMTYDEGKVMALASFGEDSHRDLFRALLRIDAATKSIKVDTALLDYHAARQGQFPRRWILATGLMPRRHGEPLTRRHMDLACSLQHCVEEAVLALLRLRFGDQGRMPLCAAGGLFLNSVMNGRIVREYNDRFHVQPASGDNGVSLGSALKVGADRDPRFQRCRMRSASLGREYGVAEISEACSAAGVTPHRPADIFEAAALLIAEGKVVGWFRGRMEFGPRALGNRSILADPTCARIKDAVNDKVKHREPFRPFAALVLLDEAGEYFEDVKESPFMLKVFRFRERYLSTFPAITHVDGSCRLQTVEGEENPELVRLLLGVRARTGHAMLLNTSLNTANQPIVNTPAEAIDLFLRSKMDAMILDDHCIIREEREWGRSQDATAMAPLQAKAGRKDQ